ncbi:MAG TPA: inositol oxygenase family protein [Acidimicrobiales bacterium]|nr:inositol oxygenase family protein [Acidimicrobiales bacterium]
MALLRRAAHVLDADRVDSLAHALQCAEVLRQRHPDDLELQIAGLVHDLGHVAGDVEAHGRAGRVLVEELLGERVAALVELHVPAKRYLVTIDAAYHGGLSPTSVATLVAQGGPMTDDEVAAFEAEPHHGDALVLRRADEAAKVPGREVPDLDQWEPRLAALAVVVRDRRRS